jgi:hypothetical protein
MPTKILKVLFKYPAPCLKCSLSRIMASCYTIHSNDQSMIIIVNCAECFQNLPVKTNLRLLECCWQVIQNSWTCYRINSAPKVVVCISNDNDQGCLSPYPVSAALPPITLPPLSAYSLPFFSSMYLLSYPIPFLPSSPLPLPLKSHPIPYPSLSSLPSRGGSRGPGA